MNTRHHRRHTPYTSTPRRLTHTLDDLLFDAIEFFARKVTGLFRRQTNRTHHKR